ncbi:MAG: ABC transporter ATP-binding protein [Synechocystis sp.]
MLHFNQISHRIDGVAVVRDLSFTLAAGEVYGLLGPNGAGKTTIINLISQLRRPDSGQILLRGRPLQQTDKRWLGIAPQENLFYRSLSCRENLNFFGTLYGLDRRTCRHRADWCLAAVNLTEKGSALVENLSGGMQRRLNLAIALMHKPQVLILDEPTTGLDIESRYDLWQLIQTLRREGMTLLLTTHLLDEAEKLCDRIGILHRGQLLTEGSLGELRHWVPAHGILTVSTDDDAQAIAVAQTLQWQHRWYGGKLAFWLPEDIPLATIIDKFQPLTFQSLACHPVTLEHIYLEVTRQANADGHFSL